MEQSPCCNNLVVLIFTTNLRRCKQIKYDKVSGNDGIHTYALQASKSLVQWAAYKESGDNQTSTVPVLQPFPGLYAPGEPEKQDKAGKQI